MDIKTKVKILIDNWYTNEEMTESEKELMLYDLAEGSLGDVPPGIYLTAHNLGIPATKKGIKDWLNN